MNFTRRFMLLLFAFIIVGVSLTNAYAQAIEKAPGVAAVEALQRIIVDKPALITDRDTIIAMQKAAETQRVDALLLLIKGLSFNENPNNSNELRTQDMLIPAIQIIKEQYGTLAVPYLYIEGITTDQAWMRERCALAVRTIASKEEIALFNNVFSLEKSASPNRKEFLDFLTREKLKVKLYDPTEALGLQLDKAIENIRKNK